MLEKSMGGFESLPKSGTRLTRVEVSLLNNIKSKTVMQLILYCLTYKGLHL